jgi:hypothetical protein
LFVANQGIGDASSASTARRLSMGSLHALIVGGGHAASSCTEYDDV